MRPGFFYMCGAAERFFKLPLDMLYITVYTVHMNGRVADADLYIRVLKGVESDGAV